MAPEGRASFPPRSYAWEVVLLAALGTYPHCLWRTPAHRRAVGFGGRYPLSLVSEASMLAAGSRETVLSSICLQCFLWKPFKPLSCEVSEPAGKHPCH